MLKKVYLALVLGALMLMSYKAVVYEQAPTLVNPTPEKVWNTSLEVPPDVRLLSLECGSPCMVYWDPTAMQYVAAFANGGVIYFTLPTPSE